MAGMEGSFRLLWSLSTEPALIVSASGEVLTANTSAVTGLFGGRSPGAGTLLQTLVCDAPDAVLQYLRLSSRTSDPPPGTLTISILGAPATPVPCFACAAPGRDAHQPAAITILLQTGELTRNQFSFLDKELERQRTEIVRRIEAERAALRHSELLDVTLASVGDGVIATDQEGRVTFFNAAAQTHTGLKQEEALGRDLADVLILEDEVSSSPARIPLAATLVDRDSFRRSGAMVLVRRDGLRLPVDYNVAPIKDSGGRTYGTVLVFQEVGERRRLERELRLRNSALEENDRRKDEFLAVLAHELRNPLAPLRNGVLIARRMAGTADLGIVIAMMDRQVSRFARLVDDLMDVSRITRGVVELRKQRLQVRDIVYQSIEVVQPEFTARGHRLQLDFPDPDLALRGDLDRLIQVLTNLLSNSAKYSPDPTTVTLSVEQAEEGVRFRVTDGGIGISGEDLEHVFDLFSQVRGRQAVSAGGLGIGLALVRRLVELHGGSVTASSAGLGRGSTFTVHLPSLGNEVAPVSPRHEPPPLEEYPDSGRLRILIADDNVDAADSLSALLAHVGHDVLVARDGAEAVEVFKTSRADLLFMDIGMPQMDGLDAARRIRAPPGGDSAYIVALSGWGQDSDRLRTRSAGMDDHFTKPIGQDEITRALRAARQKACGAHE